MRGGLMLVIVLFNRNAILVLDCIICYQDNLEIFPATPSVMCQMWWIFRASVLPTYRKIKVSRAQVDCFPTCCADRGFAPRTPRVNHRHAFLLAKCVNVNPMFDVDYEYLTTTTQPLSLPSKIHATCRLHHPHNANAMCRRINMNPRWSHCTLRRQRALGL